MATALGRTLEQSRGPLNHSKLRQRLAILTAAVSACAALPLADSAQAAPPVRTDRQVDHLLHAVPGVDARIADDSGRTVVLRGVNVNGLGQYYQEWPDLPATAGLTEDDFAQIAADGADVVRLIISWSLLEPSRGVIDQGYLDRIAQAVEWARAHDIYVILDMHQDAWGPAVDTPDGVWCPPFGKPAVGFDGAPAWATALAGTPATCRFGERELSIAVQTSFLNFYTDAGGIQSELVGVWAAVAARFAADPTVAGYDLLNEPNPGLAIGLDDYVLLGNYYQRATSAIRAAERAAPHGNGHIVFFEPSVITGPFAMPGPQAGFTGSAVTGSADNGSATGSSGSAGSATGSAGGVHDQNSVYAPHQYNESINPLGGTLSDGFATTATAAKGYGTTFFNGEWGFWDSDPAVVTDKVTRFAALEDRYRVGGTFWDWRQACGDPHNIQIRGTRPNCTAGQETGLQHDPSILTVVSRAFPRAAPGTLTGITADPATGTLTITGTADHPGRSTDLWVPSRCANPAVTGTGIGTSQIQPVTGGWRVTTVVPSAGGYTVSIGCA